MSETSEPFAGVIQSLNIQAEFCERLGSPFSASMMKLAGEDVSSSGATRGLMRRWAGVSARTLFEEAAPIRLLGALHHQALSELGSALADAYPKLERPGDAQAAWRAALAVIDAAPERLETFMDHEPQTNEVRRSACLMPGFLEIARLTSLPIRAFEVGASAGLNQLWDRYHYELEGAGSWGPLDSGVRIPCEWRGSPPPLDAAIQVVERAACDRKPVDIEDGAARLRLRAYVWADQFDRLKRLDVAMALAREVGIRVDTEDALGWTARCIEPRAGAVTAIFHSVFWQYMPEETQRGLQAAIHDIAARATDSAPFAWLRMEPPPADMATMELRLTLWPGGHDRRLATVHPHGAWVDWSG